MNIRTVLVAGFLLSVSGTPLAEDLILDGEEIPLAAGSSVTINPVTGDITAASANGNLVCTDPGAVSVSTLNASPNPVQQQEQLTVSWSSTNATSCEPVGTLPEWLSANIGLQGPETFGIVSQPGDYDVGVECSNPGGTATSNIVTVTVEEADPDAPTINSWTASPTTVDAGDSITFSWSTTDATSCSAQGNLPGWSGPKSTQGPESITVPIGTTPSNYSARLSCSNASGSTTSNAITITVQDGGIAGCDNRPAPQGMSRDAAILYNSSASTLTWFDFFSQEFPNGQTTRKFTIDENEYAALEFTTGSSVSAQDQVNFSPPQGMGNTVGGFKLITISECPGDFGAQDDPRCRWTGIGVSSDIRFGAQDSGFTCPISPNTRYFLNIVFSEDETVTSNPSWFCPGSTCGGLVFAPNQPN